MGNNDPLINHCRRRPFEISWSNLIRRYNYQGKSDTEQCNYKIPFDLAGGNQWDLLLSFGIIWTQLLIHTIIWCLSHHRHPVKVPEVHDWTEMGILEFNDWLVLFQCPIRGGGNDKNLYTYEQQRRWNYQTHEGRVVNMTEINEKKPNDCYSKKHVVKSGTDGAAIARWTNITLSSQLLWRWLHIIDFVLLITIHWAFEWW